MIGDITIGQYYAAKSPVHRLDPRVKILLTLAVLVLMFLCKAFLALGLAAFVTVGVILLSRVPLNMIWKSIRPLVFIIFFTAILNLFFNQEGNVLVSWWRFQITDSGLAIAAFMALRIICVVVVGSLLTYTTTPTMLTDAIERLLSPLSIFKIRAHTLAMMMTLALRFIPVLIEETERIMNAQKARGADFESGGLLSRAKAMVSIFVPLLISAFRRAYELAFAMECRCYTGGEGRTRMKRMKISLRDLAACLLIACFTAGVILLNRYFPAVM